MPSTLIQLKDMEGIISNIDARKLNTPVIIRGANFLWGIDGPYSGLGYVLASASRTEDAKLGNLINCGGFDIEDTFYAFTENGIREYNTATKAYSTKKLSYTLTAGVRGKWSIAEVNKEYYFSHIGLGNRIIKFVPVTDTWSFLSTNVPNGARAVISVSSRLVILGSNQYSWSALDDGDNLEASLTTGAGSQGISLVGGEAYTMNAIRDGFFIFTSKGIIKATFTGAVGTFSHRTIHENIHPLNAFCTENIDQYRVVILSNEGLVSSEGNIFQTYSAVMSDYLRNFLANLISTNPDYYNYALWFDAHRSHLWVSISDANDKDSYDYALLQNIHLDKWGRIDEEHKCVLNFNRTWFGNGKDQLNIFNANKQRVIRPATAGDDEATGLGSFIEVGLVRLLLGERTDEITDLMQVSVAAGEADFDQLFEDWNTLIGEEDWNLLDGSEDWGFNIIDSGDFITKVKASYDGDTVFDEANEENGRLELFQSERVKKFYSCDLAGIYFSIEIGTGDIPRNFYDLNLIELSGMPVGNLGM